MRVIAGVYRHRILDEVHSDKTRETKDRVKESMFNNIQADIYDAHVLDLFAGSGSLGIEAISRGCKDCVFVDVSSQAVQTIQSNITKLEIANQAEVYQHDYASFLDNLVQPFDIILLDPPYQLAVLDDIIKTIATKKLLRDDGIIVCLYHKNDALNKQNSGIIEYKKKTIGITNISFMKWGI